MNGKQVVFLLSVGTSVALMAAAGIFLWTTDDMDDGGVRIVATFYPLYYIAEQIGGGRVSVTQLIPDNMEPHSWDPRVQDILRVDRADVFIYNGGGFEPWVEDLLASSRNDDLVLVDTSKGIELDEGPDHVNGTDQDHGHGSDDPHFWLDPLLAKVQVDNVLEGLESADPNGATTFRSNAEDLKARLDSLHQEFRVGLSNRTKDDIITTHEGFNHLAERYGFTAHAALGISGDEQPSVQDMAGLVELMEELDLRYVFVDPAFSDQYMGTISRETGAELLVLDGLHGRMGVHSDLDYFDIMYENLKSLKEGLEVVGAPPL